MEEKKFQRKMIDYYRKKGRSFPWRETKNDFHALVAEVMLQKTTSKQVKQVYQKFIEKYPTPESVCRKSIKKIEDYFKNLGLKKRADVILNIAEFLRENSEVTQKNLLEIPGIGRYTANAFLSILKGRRYPIVDGNVERVFRKFFNVEDNRPPYRNKQLWSLAKKLIPKRNIRDYNLGLIDYGAMLKRNKEKSS